MAISDGVHGWWNTGGHFDPSLVTRKKYIINNYNTWHILYTEYIYIIEDSSYQSVTNDSLEVSYSPRIWRGKYAMTPTFGGGEKKI